MFSQPDSGAEPDAPRAHPLTGRLSSVAYGFALAAGAFEMRPEFKGPLARGITALMGKWPPSSRIIECSPDGAEDFLEVRVPDYVEGEAEAERIWDVWHALLTSGGTTPTPEGYEAMRTLRAALEGRLERARAHWEKVSSEGVQVLEGFTLPGEAAAHFIEVDRDEILHVDAVTNAVKAFCEAFETFAEFGAWKDLKRKYPWSPLESPLDAMELTYTEDQRRTLAAIAGLDLDRFDHDAKGTDLFKAVADALPPARNWQTFRGHLETCRAWTSGRTLGENRGDLLRAVAAVRGFRGDGQAGTPPVTK